MLSQMWENEMMLMSQNDTLTNWELYLTSFTQRKVD